MLDMNNMNDMNDIKKAGPIALTEAPQNVPLKVVRILGGHGIRRRLLAMGFHPGDIVELDAAAPFNGPVVVRNVRSDTKIALGRGVAQKIIVSADQEHG